MSFRRLSRSSLVGLAAALEANKPLGRPGLAALVAPDLVDGVDAELSAMALDGMAPRHIARALRLLADERDAAQKAADRVQLVWSPPDLDRVDARDTAVVVQELFRSAASSIVICTYNLDSGTKAQALFGELARRLDAEAGFSVRLYANVIRPYPDPMTEAERLRAFRAGIRELWPGARMPDVYYDVRALDPDWQKRASLHAKIVVADRRCTLVSSANFTEAAQERNIEAGVLVEDPRLAERVLRQIDGLVASGVFNQA